MLLFGITRSSCGPAIRTDPANINIRIASIWKNGNAAEVIASTPSFATSNVCYRNRSRRTPSWKRIFSRPSGSLICICKTPKHWTDGAPCRHHRRRRRRRRCRRRLRHHSGALQQNKKGRKHSADKSTEIHSECAASGILSLPS